MLFCKRWLPSSVTPPRELFVLGHHIEEVDAEETVHSAVAKLVITSNPKVNETCPESIFNEKMIDRLATVFGGFRH